MKTQLKKYLNKHKNRIFSLIAFIVFIPCFSFNAFADTIIIDETESYSFTARSYFGIYSGAYMNDVGIATGSGSRLYNKSDVTATSDSYYSLDNKQLNNVSYLNVTFRAGESYPIISDLYDYYLYFYWSFDDICTFNPDKFIVTYNDGTTNILHSFEPFTVLPYNMDGKAGFGCYSKVDFSTDMAINSICVGDSRMNATVGAYAHFWALIIPIEKGSSQEQVNSIISAINNQTDTLGGYIDKGNSSTSGIVSDNNSAVDNLNEVVSEYHATEQQFFDDFTANQQAINSDIVGWSWGGLVNCANWVGETMTDYYNNMGDFRQYIIYPLMLGIVLFFLGRGGAIIGHLFRKPTQSTVNIESTSFKRGNTRYTTTTTSKKGGVFRK